MFLDTTLPNIASRWKELEVPIIVSRKDYEAMKEKMSGIIQNHWRALKEMDELWETGDIYNM